MKALRFDGDGLRVTDIPKPEQFGEALVRVSLSGICNTDLEIVRGYAGFQGTIGHEFVGVVERADGRPELVGRRVVGEINAGCGVCDKCSIGDARHCAQRTVLGIVGRDGAHAEYLNLPAGNLLVLPDEIEDEMAVFAEPLAAAAGITEQVKIVKGTSVAVIGDGKLGLLCAMALALESANVTLVGKHPDKMALVEKTGVSACEAGNVPGTVNKTFDVVVEASGSETGLASAIDLVRPRGKIVLKSTFSGSPIWDASRVVVDEISIVGSRCGRFWPAVDLLSSGRIDPTPMISATFDLKDGLMAISRASEKGVLKVLLRP